VRRLGLPLQEGRLDADLADAAYRALTRPRVRVAGRQAAPSPAATAVTYDEARRREAVARAEMAEREAALQAAELVPVADVRRALAARLTAARERLVGMSSRLAPLVAAETDALACAALIDQEVVDALREVSAARVGPEGAA
jgi:hypothetical protein